MKEEVKTRPGDDPEKIKPLMDRVIARMVAHRRESALEHIESNSSLTGGFHA